MLGLCISCGVAGVGLGVLLASWGWWLETKRLDTIIADLDSDLVTIKHQLQYVQIDIASSLRTAARGRAHYE